MSVAQSGCDFGGDFVQRLSDDLTLSVGRLWVLQVGALWFPPWMWRYLSVANCRRSWPVPWDGSIDVVLQSLLLLPAKIEPGQLTWINASTPCDAIVNP